MVKKNKNREVSKIFEKISSSVFLILLCALLYLGLFLLSLDIFYAKKFFPKTVIAGYDVSGKTVNEVRNLLHGELKNFNSGLTFIHEGALKKIKPEDTGIHIDLEKTIEKAYVIGREPMTISGILDKLSLLFKNIDVKLDYYINQEIFNNFVEKEFIPAEIAQNMNLSLDEENFNITAGRPGKGLNKKHLLVFLHKQIKNFSVEPLKLPMDNIYSGIGKSELQSAKLGAKKIFSEPLTLKFENKQWIIKPDELRSWIDFSISDNKKLQTEDYLENDNLDLDNFILSSLGMDVWAGNKNDKILTASLNRELIGDLLESLAKEINIKAQDARFQMTDGRLSLLKPSEKGRELLIDGNFEKLKEKVKTDNREMFLLTRETGADVTAENIDELGIEELIAVGESNFSGSPRNRRHNIKVAAEKLNGILVKPEDTYSLVENIGEVNAEAGYLPELVIKENKTIPEYGGGLCQIATTNFRAAVNAGLEIAERQSHSYAVSYYNPQGTDATIYIPHPDLRFINDTPAYILIQTKIEGNKLYFEFYGTSDGREVELVGPHYWDRRGDGSFKAKWLQIVRREGEEIRKQQFVSNYDSPAKYH
jgi:vancomycin resistance protein YoaR